MALPAPDNPRIPQQEKGLERERQTYQEQHPNKENQADGKQPFITKTNDGDRQHRHGGIEKKRKPNTIAQPALLNRVTGEEDSAE